MPTNSRDDVSRQKRPAHRHERSTREIMANLLSGATAGAVAKSTIAPFDRAKIRFQVSSKVNFTYRNCGRFLASTVRDHGIVHLWKGNSATMVRIMPYAAISFMSNEHYKQHFKQRSETGRLSHGKRFLSGSLAGLTASFSTYGLEVLRSRMAIQSGYNHIVQSFKHIIKTEGVLSLYRGITPTLIGVALYGGCSFYIFGTLKHAHPFGREGEDLTLKYRLLYGAVAGLCGQSVSYPLDVTRRRMQTGGRDGTHLERYSTMRGTLAHIYKNEGIKLGLYKGLSLNFVKGPISVSISYTVFDYVNHYISGKESY